MYLVVIVSFTFPCLIWQIILGMKLVDKNDTNVLEYPQKVNGIERILDDRLCRESGWGHKIHYTNMGVSVSRYEREYMKFLNFT